jgi:hypothetical protein
MDDRTDVVELLVGCRRDPCFGPLVAVGLGGVTAELAPDAVLELAPVSVGEARAMIGALRGFALLDGWRGRPRLDVDAAARIVALLAGVFCARADLAALEINPVRVGVGGALAVDALLVGREAGGPS